tara:strand:+ start:61 stop:762 length:702 start_codon:yes stop_codon:yes gene_type:complete
MNFNIFKRNNNYNQWRDIKNFKLNSKIEDIYIIGNGPSLNNFKPEQFENKFTIGTNRAWLWGNTNILIWRDHRITEEIDFFKLEKKANSLWFCSNDKSLVKDRLVNYKHVGKFIDYTFNDKWIKQKLKVTIKWNGIVFHAITLAKHISVDATIHLIGIDLQLDNLNDHHFFSNLPGFNQGFYKKNWDKNNFNFKSRLDMMYKNFELLKNNGFIFKNYSENSRLRHLFGVDKIV